MKKYMICFVSALVLGFSSCDLMDLKPLDQLSEEDVWNDEELLQLYVNGCYNALQHGYRYTDMMGIYCDEMYTRSNDGRVVEYLAGTMDADNITGMGILNYWSTAYSYIRKINTFLEKAEAGSVPEEVKRPMIGEMKFIRAYIYAELIWRYGGVPIIEKVYGLNDDFGVERASYDKCVEFIRNELIEAQRMLPEQQPASEQGRASGDACQALLARVLLYWASPLNNPTNDRQRWTDAANAAWALIDKRYRLIDDYGDVFLSWNDEVIFARAFSQANSTEFATWAGRSGDNGQGVITPTQNMVNAYEMQATGLRPYVEQADGTLTLNAGSGYDPANPYAGRDPRFYASVLYDGSVWMGRETEIFYGGLDEANSKVSSQPWNATQTGYYLRKFLDESIPPTGSSVKMTSPWIFMRYAEVLLNYAEAKFEEGNEPTARFYLKQVRQRPGVNMPEVMDSGDALRERIHNERRVELAFEHHRFFDVRRWRVAERTETFPLQKMVITKDETSGTKNYDIQILKNREFRSYQLLLPIPRTEIEKSLNTLEQNDGYVKTAE